MRIDSLTAAELAVYTAAFGAEYSRTLAIVTPGNAGEREQVDARRNARLVAQFAVVAFRELRELQNDGRSEYEWR